MLMVAKIAALCSLALTPPFREEEWYSVKALLTQLILDGEHTATDIASGRSLLRYLLFTGRR